MRCVQIETFCCAAALLATSLLLPTTAAAQTYETVRVKDIVLSGSSNPKGFVAAGGIWFFVANDVTTGDELWKSDGTGPGTIRVKDACAGSASASIDSLTSVGSRVFYGLSCDTVQWQLWVSDGTDTGTHMIAETGTTTSQNRAKNLTSFNGDVFFSFASATAGRELWKSNGSSAELVKDISPGTGSSSPEHLTVHGGQLFFGAIEAGSEELWSTDGTLAGTLRRVAGTTVHNISDLTSFGTILLFQGLNGTGTTRGFELWKFAAGVASEIRDINPGVNPSLPTNFRVVGGLAYFAANDGNAGTELWSTDGTTASLVMDIAPGSSNSNPRSLTAAGNRLFFVADTAAEGAELWTGANESPRRVKSITTIGEPRYLMHSQVANKLFFLATTGEGAHLWSTNATTATEVSTDQITHPDSPATFSAVTEMHAMGWRVLMQAGADTEPWIHRPACADAPSADGDDDGVPNCVEYLEGLNPGVKDNDIFGNARLFAMQQYRDFLGREGDAEGIQFYVNLLNGGTATRFAIIESFLLSPEFQNGLPSITRLYFSFFGRIPDYGGLTFQLAAFRSGTPLEVIAQNFVNSPEFTNTYGALTNDQYINLVYQNVLNRPPDPDGYTFYLNHLNNGTLTKGQMMIGFSESVEFQNLTSNESFVVGVYVGMLKRTPEPAGLDFYVDLLDGGTARSAIIPGFFNSPEYHSRFLP